MSEIVLYVMGAAGVLVGMLLYEIYNSLRRDRDMYRDLCRQSDQRMSELVAQLSPEAEELDLGELNAKYNRSRLN